MTARRYEPGTRGFVVQHDHAGVQFPGQVLHSWWYGADRAWPNTWGGLDYSVAVFPSRPAARKAYEAAVRAWDATDPSYRIRSVADAEADRASQIAAWEARVQS